MASSAIDQVVSLCKRRGFVFPCGEIYGGTRSAWDYGPLGVELKENIKRQWWRSMVTSRDDVVGLDSSVILPTKTWEASGHLATFTDPLTECQSCHKRFRADHLQEAVAEKKGIDNPDDVDLATIACPNCGTRGAWTEPRPFNGMLKTYLGVIEDESGLHYLRPETAQGIFLNFVNVMNSSRKKPPFGIAQIGKSFRNEITPGQLHLPHPRVRADGDGVLRRARHRRGVAPDLDRPAHRLVHRSRHRPATTCGTSSTPRPSCRTTPSAPSTSSTGSASPARSGASSRASPTAPTSTSSSTAKFSGQDLSYFDQATGERWTPYVIEPAAGLTRSLMAFLIDAYAEDEAPNAKGGVDKRTVLRLDPRLAPVKVAVLPLSRNADLSPKAKALAAELRQHWNVDFDDAGAIGRRYRRQDEIGTPYCVTVDFDSLDDDAATVRERDSMAQERVSLDKLAGYFAERLIGC